MHQVNDQENQVLQRFACACCRLLTLFEPKDSSAICRVCWWEEDRIQERDPDYRGGANRPSLNIAKLNFASVGITQAHLIFFKRAPLEVEIPSGIRVFPEEPVARQDSCPCACCGYLTFESQVDNTLRICPVCFWTDEGLRSDASEDIPEWRPALNQVALDVAQQNFRLLGAYHPRYLPYVRTPEPEERP